MSKVDRLLKKHKDAEEERNKIKARERYHSIIQTEQGKEHLKMLQRKYYSTGKELRRKKELYHQRKLLVLTHYGGNPPKCACCGETHMEFLTLDHIHGGGNKHREKIMGKHGSYRKLYKWIIDNKFPPIFRILCFNCNTSYGFYGYCPHHDAIALYSVMINNIKIRKKTKRWW